MRRRTRELTQFYATTSSLPSKMLFTIASLVASGFTVGPAAHVARSGVRATAAQMFAVTLVMEDGSKSTIECGGEPVCPT